VHSKLVRVTSPVAPRKRSQQEPSRPLVSEDWVLLGSQFFLALLVVILTDVTRRNAATVRKARRADSSSAASDGNDGYSEEGAFPRLQERVLIQLGFINSLLITLAVGLLAFAANASSDSTELARLGWRKWFLIAGTILLALSALAGIGLARNRLRSHRMTARTARLRQLRDRLQKEQRSYELIRLARQADFLQRWDKYGVRTSQEKVRLHGAAQILSNVIPDNYKQQAKSGLPRVKATVDVQEVAGAATSLVEALRSWYEKADDVTWQWLKFQTLTFVLGAVPLVVVPLSYYVRL
jgi:hypothetical protein